MQIINSLHDIKIKEKTAVALGNFDGIHIGHMVILEDALKSAKEKGLRSVCYTFANHPFNFIMNRDENDPDGIKLICTEDQKIRMLDELGFDYLVNVPFDEEIMTMRAKPFIDDVLIRDMNAEVICVGFNYTFGARAEGKPEMLIEECGRVGVEVRVHDAVYYEGNVVSSTLIRKTVEAGDMELAAAYLGRDYCFEGVVEHGKRIGSGIGFPTINLPAPVNRALPPSGVYFGHTQIGQNTYRSISNIGVKPTVSESDIKNIETYIFDFSNDCYGEKASVYFEHFHRPEQHFDDKEALRDQIAMDCEAAERYFAAKES